MKIFIFFLICHANFAFAISTFKPQDIFEAALYEDAVEILEKQVNEEEKNIFTLAKCYFALDRFEDVIALLQKYSLTQEEKHLLAVAYQRIEKHDQAISILSLLEKDEIVSYDLAISYFSTKDYANAQAILDVLSVNNQNKNIQNLANIYLIKLDLEKGHFDNAEKKLQALLANDLRNPHLNFLFGDLYFRKKEFEKAIAYFESILPKRNKMLASWYQETLYHLGWCYLNIGEIQHSKQAFEKAELFFSELSDHFNSEKIFLSYAEVLISKGKHFEDKDAYCRANRILDEETNFVSIEGKNKARLMKAEAALEYEERERRYADLIELVQSENLQLADSWYLRGVNEWNQGQLQKNKMLYLQAKKHFKRATDFLKQAYELYDKESLKAAITLKFVALAYLAQGEIEDIQKAIHYFTLCIQSNVIAHLEDPLELYYLRALAEMEIKEKIDLKEACQKLELGMTTFQRGAFLDKAAYLIGQLYYECNEFEKAEASFLRVPHDFPNSNLCADAYYLASLSVEGSKKSLDLAKQYKQIVYEKYSSASIAAEAFFTYYSYQEYLSGDRKMLKHLQALPAKFPDSPFSLNAYYLLGMDLKRDRKSPQGKWISKKNLTQSIEAFANVESCFDRLFENNLISPDKLDYYIQLRYRAILEMALSNYTIAEEAKGAKRQIYLEYAGEVFKKVLAEFRESNHPLAKRIKERELFSKILEESYYYLVKIYGQTDSVVLAEKAYKEAIEQYQKSHITKSYFLAKLFTERGLIAFAQKNFSQALHYFKMAEEAGNGKILNSDEALDLLIQQSLCLQEMDQPEDAMLLLSEVINCDVASSLRLKAMFLRAGLYEKLGKPQLAKRQLETIVAKGGDWAQVAQEKLDKDYGFY